MIIDTIDKLLRALISPVLVILTMRPGTWDLGPSTLLILTTDQCPAQVSQVSETSITEQHLINMIDPGDDDSDGGVFHQRGVAHTEAEHRIIAIFLSSSAPHHTSA